MRVRIPGRLPSPLTRESRPRARLLQMAASGVRRDGMSFNIAIAACARHRDGSAKQARRRRI